VVDDGLVQTYNLSGFAALTGVTTQLVGPLPSHPTTSYVFTQTLLDKHPGTNQSLPELLGGNVERHVRYVSAGAGALHRTLGG